MRYTVGQLARKSGVSVRTLRYYDALGLLCPAGTAANGYRWYDEASCLRLQQILFYRELDFPLAEIAQILAAPDYDPRAALARQKALLELRQQRLGRLIAQLDAAMKGEKTMEFTAFDTTEYDKAKEKYAEEVKARWGDTAAYAESEQKHYDNDAFAALKAQSGEIFGAFAALAAGKADPAGEKAQALVGQWQAFITAHWYACTKEILAGLGEMYTADLRFTASLDAFGPGTAQFLHDAIAAYCKA